MEREPPRQRYTNGSRRFRGKMRKRRTLCVRRLHVHALHGSLPTKSDGKAVIRPKAATCVLA